MLSLQPRSMLEIPHRPSRGLSFRRLRRPTPLPTLTPPFESESLANRLFAVLGLTHR